MKTLVTGASGLIGSALVAQLRKGGHKVVRLVRQASDDPDAFAWDPVAGTMDPRALNDVEAVVHLAGAPIAAGRWTAKRKQLILESRTQSTRLLAEGLAQCVLKPRVWVCASGVGIYGSRGDEWLNEDSDAGDGFLASVAQAWEAATAPAAAAGVRVVTMRLGVVLSAQGGALPRMVQPFRLGVGGPVGSGRQYMSWVTLDDAVAAIRFMVEQDDLSGPVNLVSPSPCTQRVFATTLGRVLHRPARVPLPAWAVRLLMGQMGEELLLGSTRATPETLTAAGFVFQYPDLEKALRHVLQGPDASGV